MKPSLELVIVYIFICAVPASAAPLRAALIGDYGRATSEGEAKVAALVKSWSPDCILTMGDNNYPRGEWATIDANIGQYYGDFIYPLTDSNVSSGAADKINKFFPALGNHDGYSDGAWGGSPRGAFPILHYLRGISPDSATNGDTMHRYYTVTKGSVQFFLMNSNGWEPDGIDVNSRQMQWLRVQLQQSTAPHRVVIMHHLPYSSNQNDPATPALRLPYKEWGASVLVSGHSHSYERLEVDGFTYLQNGLGGTVPIYPHFSPDVLSSSRTWYNQTWGAQLLEADDTAMTITFRSLMSPTGGVYEDRVVFSAVYPTTTTTVLAPSPSSTSRVLPAIPVPDASSSSTNDNLGIGILIGVIVAVTLGGTVYAFMWFRHRRQERAEAALGGGARTFSIMPTVAYRSANADDETSTMADYSSPLQQSEAGRGDQQIETM